MNAKHVYRRTTLVNFVALNYSVQCANRTYFIRDRLEIKCNVPDVIKRLIVLIPSVYTTGDFFITIYVFVDNARIRFR